LKKFYVSFILIYKILSVGRSRNFV